MRIHLLLLLVHPETIQVGTVGSALTWLGITDWGSHILKDFVNGSHIKTLIQCSSQSWLTVSNSQMATIAPCHFIEVHVSNCSFMDSKCCHLSIYIRFCLFVCWFFLLLCFVIWVVCVYNCKDLCKILLLFPFLFLSIVMVLCSLWLVLPLDSGAERLILSKLSVLYSIQVFIALSCLTMSCLLSPIREDIQRICKPKTYGYLGVGRVVNMNTTLLAKLGDS